MSERYTIVPPLARGYPLNARHPPLSVIVPIARTNLVTNPSLETNTTNWTAVGGSIARSTAQQYHGAYSLAITPTSATGDGCYYGSIALTNGQFYAVSCKFLGVAGVKYKLSVATTGGSDLVAYRFVATGRWQWIWVYYLETSSTNRRLYVTKDGQSSTGVFYVDGMQCEAINTGEYVSTYIDGDQVGLVPNQAPPAYLWNGTPHASTSQRSGQTRAGGRVVRLDEYGFLLLGINGLGAAPVENIRQDFALLDGAQDLRSRKAGRLFTLIGQFEAASDTQLDRNIADLTQALDRDLIGQDQPLILLYQRYHCDTPISDTLSIPCKYKGGLEGLVDSEHRMSTGIVFDQATPALYGGDQGVALTTQQTINNINYVAMRDTSGLWNALGTGMNGVVNAVVQAPDGSIYIGGAFTTAGGTTVNGIAKWNPQTSTFSALGGTPGVSGGTATVSAVAVAPNGDVYIGGNFTAAGGGAAANIAKWNGSAWSALGSGTNGTVSSLVFGPDGSLYLGGSFTAAGGVANTRAIAKWDGSAYTALGTGAASTPVQALIFGLDGYLYAGGDFSGMGGVANTLRIARWSGSAWSALSTGMNASGGALIALADGTVYAGGAFTTAGGVSCSQIARWNGQIWQPLGSGVNGTVYSFALAPDGSLWAGGNFTTAGGITLADRFARWTGGTWVLPDVDLPGTPIVQSISVLPSGALYLGITTTGTASAAYITAGTTGGTARTYPRLTLIGPSSGTVRVSALQNMTTGRSVFFNGTITNGETWYLDFTPTNLSFVSTFQGNIQKLIIAGSNEADFFLQPGVNNISIFCDTNLGALTQALGTLQWRLAYTNVADVTL